MRLIKLFEEFKKVYLVESSADPIGKDGITPELESDVRDIFVELRDEGIEVDVQRWSNFSNKIWVSLKPIDIISDKDSFKVGSVKEYVMMLIDYMELKYDITRIGYHVFIGSSSYSYDNYFPDDILDSDTDEFSIYFLINEVNDSIQEEFKYTDDLISDINDIFIELVDKGMNVRVLDYDDINIAISSTSFVPIQFDCSEIKEYVMMLIDYLKEKFNVGRTVYDFNICDIERDNPLATDKICRDVYKLGREPHLNTEIFPDGVIVESIIICIGINKKGIINEGFNDFNSFSYNKIESDVNDMFIDIKDSGADLDFYYYHKGVGYGAGPEDYMIRLTIHSEKLFKMSDLEDPTRMMVDYLQELTDKKVDMEYQRDRDYTHTRQREFSPYDYDNKVEIFLIERG